MKLTITLWLLAFSSVLAAPAITFPENGGIMDVREFGATSDDESDDTAAIQKALDAHPNGNRIVRLIREWRAYLQNLAHPLISTRIHPKFTQPKTLNLTTP